MYDIPLANLPLLGAIVGGGMLALWLVSLAARDASLVDIAWGAGFAVIAVTSAIVSAGDDRRRWLVAGLTAVWGLRLAGHLAWRNSGKGEDRRYAAMRRRHGARFWWVSFFTVFLFQGVVMLVVAAPLYTTVTSPRPIGGIEMVGVALWGVGLGCEAVADVQLARFKADPAHADRVLDTGIWRYSRHPNYFGDACVWWGLYLIAAPTHVWTVFSPLLMTFFLLRVSGVVLLEKTIVERRPDYRAYIERTSAFIPWPPK